MFCIKINLARTSRARLGLIFSDRVVSVGANGGAFPWPASEDVDVGDILARWIFGSAGETDDIPLSAAPKGNEVVGAVDDLHIGVARLFQGGHGFFLIHKCAWERKGGKSENEQDEADGYEVNFAIH